MKKKTHTGVVNRTIFTADNLYVMRGLESESFDLIYLDPPFNSKKQWNAPIGSEAAGAAFKDTWKLSDVDELEVELMEKTHPKVAALIKAIGIVSGGGDQSYLTMMAPRLIEMRRLLKPAGSLFLHCDPVMSHSLKLMLDAVFSGGSFCNEIIWFYPDTPGRSKRFFSKKHDVVLWYTKRKDWFFDGDAVRVPIQEDSVERYKTARVLGGRAYVGGRAAKLGKIPEDVWRIPAVKGNSQQATGYPTQKPLALLDKIIKAACPENGWLLDPFCGCATTCVAAERLKRNWVGVDLSVKAAELVVTRFQNELGLWSKEARAHAPHRPSAAHEGHRPNAQGRVEAAPLRRPNRLLQGLQQAL